MRLPRGRRLGGRRATLSEHVATPTAWKLADAVEIGPRREQELAELFALASGAFEALPGWNERRVFDVLAGDLVFVAREHGQAAGYVALHADTDGGICIDQLFVAAGHEQRGIGRHLLAYAEGYAIAERAPALRVVVEESNRPARDLYRRSGFAPVAPELLELVLPAEP
jgi:ribosomal protein S18 acetylase RimI-like enzyme